MIGAVPILLYHSVADDPSSRFARWAVAPALFEEHMAYLAGEGYRSMTVAELAARMYGGDAPVPPRPVAITFDDGFADFRSAALPILARHGMVATLFVTTGFVDGTSEWLAPLGEGRRPMLTWSQVRDVHAAGIECGAHTRAHPQLDTIRRVAAREEIVLGKRVLEDRLGAPVVSFAYPHGYHTARLRDEVRRAGFRSACAVGHALATTADDRFALSRVIVGGDTSAAALGRLLSGEGLRNHAHSRGAGRAAWRLARIAARLARPLLSHGNRPWTSRRAAR